MDPLHWKFTDFSGTNINIGIGANQIGQLKFFAYNSNAIYTTNRTKVALVENGSTQSIVLYNGDYHGKLKAGFSRPSLTLNDNQTLILKSNFLGRNLRWINSEGKIVMNFVQGTLTSRGQGTIHANDELSQVQREVLISCGLFAQKKLVANFALLGLWTVPFLLAIKYTIGLIAK
jgi:hypothetical protein